MEEDHISYEIIRHLRRCGHFLYFKTGGKTGRRQIFYILLRREELLQRELQDLLGVQSGSLSEIIIKMEADGRRSLPAADMNGRCRKCSPASPPSKSGTC